MSEPYNLQRFVEAQNEVIATVLTELRAGAKQSHWMWFIFPQLGELGRSPTAKFYGISGRAEARAYLAHPLLGPRLLETAAAILPWAGRRSAEQVLGPVDSMKLRSCLTLFDAIDPDALFGRALLAFYDGPDEATLALLAEAR